MTGRLSDELNAVPIFFGKTSRRVKRAARAGRIFAVPIHLPDFFRDREEFLAVRNGFKAARRPAAHRFVITIGNGHVHAGIAVGGGPNDEVVLAQPQAPGVVVAGTNEFQNRPVRFETIDSLAEPEVLAAHGALKTRITDRAPNPVIKTVTQVARPRVRVLGSPAGEKH